jgi:hypothetical protein
MAAPCYSGPNPADDPARRMAIWKWAKANGIDHGLPIDKVGDAINMHFFAGQAKPEWITDILSGRKTPYRALANDAWKKQYNRRQIVQQAQELSRAKMPGPIGRTVGTILSGPRNLAVFGHGLVFPVTHGGDLALRPQSWGIFFKGLFNTYTKATVSKAATERLMDSMRRSPLFDTALRSGLDVGARSHAGNLINRPAKGGMSTRAWDVLTSMRYELWDRAMQKFVKPGMSQEEVLDVGKNLAEWANHATGSAKGPIANLGGNVLFGPKLTQSKLNRLVVDPIKTVKTFANWKNATPGEKAVAWTRFSGSAQYAASMLGFLAVNQGLILATRNKDQKDQKDLINFTNPNKSDWLAFKAGGIEWSMPGMHSEIKTIGQILATSFMNNKELHGQSRASHLGEILGQYALGRANPAIGVGKEILIGQNFIGRPLPWNPQPGTLKRPKMGWWEYGLSHGPIPLTGPIGYFYDQMRAKEADPSYSINVIKGLILGSIDLTGIHASDADRPQPSKEALKKEAAEHRKASAIAKREAAIQARREAVAKVLQGN